MSQIIDRNYVTITHDIETFRVLKHINDHDYFAFDTETTGLNVRKEKVIGMSISGKAGESYYICRYVYDKESDSLVQKVSDEIFIHILNTLKEKELLMWNASFDIRVVESNFNIDLTESLIADVMLMKHTLHEDGDFKLKQTMIELQDVLGMDMEKAANQEQIELKESVSKNGGSTTNTNFEMYKADLPVLAKYANADADFTLRIAEHYLKEINKQGLFDFFFKDEVMPLYKYVTINMERKGVKLDLELIKNTKLEIEKDIKNLHDLIVEELFNNSQFNKWLRDTSAAKFPPSSKGNFGQKVASFFELDLPISEKTGKYSMGKKHIETLIDTRSKQFLLGDVEALLPEQIELIQIDLWKDHNGGPVNISSKKQMAEIAFNYFKEKPLSTTDKGSPQFNDSMIDHLSEKYNWAKLLGDYNKLIKIRSAYIDRFLDNNEDGYYYFYYKQHGTISGRFSSDAQQLPRPKEEGELSELVLKYNNIIRSFFIAEEDRIFIDSDYESLEPHVFSHVSNDEGLMGIFRKGHDFYSTIAIATEKLEGVSADKKADNYLGKVNKPLRQKAKAYSLGIPYGMSPYALAKSIDVSQEEAEELYNGYLNGFPNLKKWMKSSKFKAQNNGFVKTQTGRVRHLPKVKTLHKKHKDKLLDFKYRKAIEKNYGKDEVREMYRDYKNGLNNSLNFQIQGLSASIVNRAMIAINKHFIDNDIDAWVCSTIHDQIIVNCPKHISEECKKVVEKYMVSVVKLNVELKAPPELSKNWKEGH